MQSDRALVLRVRGGDVEAFEHLVVRYRRAAMLTALRVLRDHHAAEDAVQESFVLAYRRLATLRTPSRFAGWLMRIVGRQALRIVEKATVAAPTASMQDFAAPGDDPLRERCERLIELIDRLPIHERVVVTLRHLDGHSITEITEITGRPAGTVSKQLSRALRRLRRMTETQRSSR